MVEVIHSVEQVDLTLVMDHFIFIHLVVDLEVEVHKLIQKNYLMHSLVVEVEEEDLEVLDVEAIYKCI